MTARAQSDHRLLLVLLIAVGMAVGMACGGGSTVEQKLSDAQTTVARLETPTSTYTSTAIPSPAPRPATPTPVRDYAALAKPQVDGIYVVKIAALSILIWADNVVLGNAHDDIDQLCILNLAPTQTQEFWPERYRKLYNEVLADCAARHLSTEAVVASVVRTRLQPLSDAVSDEHRADIEQAVIQLLRAAP